MPLKRRFSDTFWYIVIGVLAVPAIVVAAIIPEHWLPNKQWMAFIWFSLLLFVALAKFYWNVRKPRKFWLFFLGLLIVHILVYATVLPYIERAFWYLFIMPIEAMLIAVVIKLAFNIMPGPKTRI